MHVLSELLDTQKYYYRKCQKISEVSIKVIMITNIMHELSNIGRLKRKSS